jgi:hypothetical protein
MYASINTYSVTASGGFFQIRPQKDFRPERGRNHALSLGLLSDLPEETIDGPDPDTSAEPRNAYEFMQRRRSAEGNPTLKRWNASVRMSNFAALDVSPFAVGHMGHFILGKVYQNCRSLARFDCRIARLSHQRTSAW